MSFTLIPGYLALLGARAAAVSLVIAAAASPKMKRI